MEIYVWRLLVTLETLHDLGTKVSYSACHSMLAGVDLGFGKGGCPKHQKGAPEGAKPQTCALKARAGGGSGENLKI